MQLPFIDLLVIVVYLLGVVIFGSYFFRKVRSLEAFTVGDRAIPGWALGFSILGTYLSSVSYLALAGKSYSGNWSAFVFSLSIPIACLMASIWFIPLYRSKLQISAYEHLETKFGPWARAYAGGCFILLQLGRIGVVLYLMSLATSQLTGSPVWINILILGFLTILYCFLGGIEAVVWTDVVQVFVLFGGALVALLVISFEAPGGMAGVIELGSEADKFSFGGLGFDLAQEGFWVVMIFGIVDNLRNFGIDHNYVQRFLAAPSDAEARKSLWTGGLLYVPISAIFFFIGTGLWALYTTMDPPPQDLPELSDQIFPYFIHHGLPAGLTGLLIAGVLAAGMSTLSSSINASATVWSVDFHKRYIDPGCEDDGMLRMTRSATLAIGFLGVIASLAMIQAKQALDSWWKISSIFGGAMIGLFLLGLFVRRSTPRGGMIGVGVGVVVIFWATFCTQLEGSWARLNFPFHALLIGTVGTAAIVLVGWAESFWGGRSSDPGPGN